MNELATALGNDENYATSTATLIGTKAPINNPTFTGTVSGVTKTMVGLTNADDTTDAGKPVSTAQQTALDLKADASDISNMDNTSDTSKPVSTAQQTALDLKANSSSLTYLDATSSIQNQLDAINSTDTTQQTAIDARLPLAGGTVTGNLVSQQTLNMLEKVNAVSVSYITKFISVEEDSPHMSYGSCISVHIAKSEDTLDGDFIASAIIILCIYFLRLFI